MDKTPSIEVENDRRGILGPRLGEGWRKIGRAERRDRLSNEVDALGLACAQHRLGRCNQTEFYRPSSDSPG